jgi:hypothetical protein
MFLFWYFQHHSNVRDTKLRLMSAENRSTQFERKVDQHTICAPRTSGKFSEAGVRGLPLGHDGDPSLRDWTPTRRLPGVHCGTTQTSRRLTIRLENAAVLPNNPRSNLIIYHHLYTLLKYSGVGRVFLLCP